MNTPMNTPTVRLLPLSGLTLAGLCLVAFAVLVMLLLPPPAAGQALVSVDDQVRLKFSGIRFHRRTGTFRTRATIKNLSGEPISGPMFLLFEDLEPDTVEIIGSTVEMVGGGSLVEVALDGGELLAKKKRFFVQFSNPTRERLSFDASVVVESGVEATALSTPRSVPSALPVEQQTQVLFTVFTSDFGGPMTLRRLDTGEELVMNDDGFGGDTIAGDGVYGGLGLVEKFGIAVQTCLEFEAQGESPEGVLLSPVYELCTTGFPPAVAVSNLEVLNLIEDPDGGAGSQSVADEVVIGVVARTSEERIEELAGIVAGELGVQTEVVGSVLSLRLYQIKLSSPSTTAELGLLLDLLRGLVDVEFAALNGIIEGAQLTPSDSQFGSQAALQHLNAEAAWGEFGDFVTPGAMEEISIVDSGIDSDHPDFAGQQVTLGHDYIDDDDDPEDGHGHGMRIAGIAAARTNNGQGIASVAPGAALRVIRVLNNSKMGTQLQVIDGFKEAAGSNSRVINVSYQFSTINPAWRSEWCTEINTAIGTAQVNKLVVVSTGNPCGREVFAGRV